MKTLIDILIISLFCNGIYIVTRYGMILFFIRDFYARLANGVIKSDDEVSWMLCHKPVLRFFYKPLFGCLPCMASIWGTVGYFCLGNLLSFEYPVIIIAVACMNKIVSHFYE